MRATLNIPDELIAEVQKIAHEKSKTKAIIIAMETFIKQKKLDELRRLKGKMPLDYDWQAAETLELKVQEKREKYRGK